MSDIPKWEDTEAIETAPVDAAPPAFEDTEALDAPAAAPAPESPVPPSARETVLEHLKRRGSILSPKEELEAINDFGGSIGDKIPFGHLAEKAGAAVGSVFSDKTYDELLAAIQDINAKKKAERHERSPNASNLGEKAGMLIGPQAVKGVTAAGAAIPGMAAGLRSAASRIGVQSGLAGVDRATQEDNLPDAVDQGAKAAALAAILSGGGEALTAVAPAVKSFANTRAVKSLDPTLAQQQVLNNKDMVQDLGAELLEARVPRMMSSVDGMAPRLEEMLSQKGRKIGEIRGQADEALAVSKTSANPLPGIDMTRLRDKGTAMEAFTDASIGAEQSMAKAYRKDASRLAKLPERGVKETQEVISSLNQQIPFNKPIAEMTPAQQAAMELRRDLVGQSDDVVRQTVPGRADEYGKLKETFGLFKEGDKILEKSVARSARNADVGLRDLLTGNMAAKEGGLVGGVKGVAVAAATKLARERGNATLAVTADRVSKLMEGNPNALGKYAKPLMEALSRSPKSFLATHALLLKDPEYAAMLQGEERAP